MNNALRSSIYVATVLLKSMKRQIWVKIIEGQLWHLVDFLLIGYWVFDLHWLAMSRSIYINSSKLWITSSKELEIQHKRMQKTNQSKNGIDNCWKIETRKNSMQWWSNVLIIQTWWQHNNIIDEVFTLIEMWIWMWLLHLFFYLYQNILHKSINFGGLTVSRLFKNVFHYSLKVVKQISGHCF